jgi:hypothetical protein
MSVMGRPHGKKGRLGGTLMNESISRELQRAASVLL